jgi:uncharacterized protein YkwD
MTNFKHLRHERIFSARWLAVAVGIVVACSCSLTAQAASPAELVSSYRIAHGEGKVATDAALIRLAQEQANAMAARDMLDHAAVKPFSDRAANLNASRAAENLAVENGPFAKALDQWIGSYGHRRNLLIHEATRIGIASARSSKSGDVYWAMVIADPDPDKERPKGRDGKAKPCKLMMGDTCFQ